MTDSGKRDGLKALDDVTLPDIRHSYFGKYSLDSHYKEIEGYNLNCGVPEAIATQFDVARNLYVYAWYEYRFLGVAEANVLTVLEFAIKERIGNQAIKTYIKDRQRQNQERTGKPGRVQNGMKTLIECCRDKQLIKNEGFSAWHRQPRIKAERELTMATIRAMSEAGENERKIDYAKLKYPEPSDDYDHIQHLIDHTNKVRNLYAHGTSMLRSNVLYSFEMVSEFINQLFPDKDAKNE